MKKKVGETGNDITHRIMIFKLLHYNIILENNENLSVITKICNIQIWKANPTFNLVNHLNIFTKNYKRIF
jgi:hypothetical protein